MLGLGKISHCRRKVLTIWKKMSFFGGREGGRWGKWGAGKLKRPPRSKNSSIFFGRKMIQFHSARLCAFFLPRGTKKRHKFHNNASHLRPELHRVPSKNTFSFFLSMCSVVAAPAPTVICSSVIAASKRSCCCSVRTITAPLMRLLRC